MATRYRLLASLHNTPTVKLGKHTPRYTLAQYARNGARIANVRIASPDVVSTGLEPERAKTRKLMRYSAKRDRLTHTGLVYTYANQVLHAQAGCRIPANVAGSLVPACATGNDTSGTVWRSRVPGRSHADAEAHLPQEADLDRQAEGEAEGEVTLSTFASLPGPLESST